MRARGLGGESEMRTKMAITKATHPQSLDTFLTWSENLRSDMASVLALQLAPVPQTMKMCRDEIDFEGVGDPWPSPRVPLTALVTLTRICGKGNAADDGGATTRKCSVYVVGYCSTASTHPLWPVSRVSFLFA